MSTVINPELRRTSGDGMEQESIPKQENKTVSKVISVKPKQQAPIPSHVAKTKTGSQKSKKIPGEHTIYRPELDEPGSYLPVVIPTGKLVRLIPKSLTRKEKSATPKEPRFVPLEPYKAAVNPLFPVRHTKGRRPNHNKLDINVLVEQMSIMKAEELKLNDNQDEMQKAKTEFEKEREALLNEIKELKSQQDCTTAQLKFQVQVNSELKNLLVAAVGEDLQTRVNVLTEDKLQLARALLDTANNLSTHTEQIEYLAGQSEVWRSKFLASSVMVEELARWKADLSHKNSLLTKSNKQMLQLISQIREMTVDILKNLKFLARVKLLNIPTSNIMDLTAECLNISQQLVLHSGIGMPENIDFAGLDSITEAEKLATQALENSCQHLMATDEALKAIVGQAFHPNKSMYRTESDASNDTTNQDTA